MDFYLLGGGGGRYLKKKGVIKEIRQFSDCVIMCVAYKEYVVFLFHILVTGNGQTLGIKITPKEVEEIIEGEEVATIINRKLEANLVDDFVCMNLTYINPFKNWYRNELKPLLMAGTLKSGDMGTVDFEQWKSWEEMYGIQKKADRREARAKGIKKKVRLGPILNYVAAKYPYD